MAALPTNFSVTSAFGFLPIPNPLTSVRPPSALEAKPLAGSGGSTLLTALTPDDIGAPSVVVSQDAARLPVPSAYTAESVQVVGTPTLRTAKPAQDVGVPSSRSTQAQPATPAPSARTALAEAVAPAPSALTPSVTDSYAPPFPLNHARILYNNRLRFYSDLSASEGTPLNALIPNTWERWIFDSTASNSAILIELPVAESMDTICIGAHNLGAIGATVSLTYSTDGVAFQDWEPDFQPANAAPLMRHKSTPVTVKAIQVSISSGAAATGFIGYISAGTALQMQRPFFNGHVPITDADVTTYYYKKTESGNVIGQAVRDQGFETSYEWQNLNDGWYRQYFAPLKQVAKTAPLFIGWNLEEYPDDIGFGVIQDDIQAPIQNGSGIRRSVSFTLLGV